MVAMEGGTRDRAHDYRRYERDNDERDPDSPRSTRSASWSSLLHLPSGRARPLTR
jgi:hypothetical protein